MKLHLTDIPRPWYTGPADDTIVLEGTTYGVYLITWNKVTVGSVHLFANAGGWMPYDADGELIPDIASNDPARAALHVLDRHPRRPEGWCVMATPESLTSIPDGASWGFIDHREAFPSLPLQPRETDELNISLGAAGGGTHGEFRIVFIELGGGPPAPRLEAFNDGWAALNLSGLVPRLAELDDRAAKADVIALLLDMGMTDETDRYRSKRAARNSDKFMVADLMDLGEDCQLDEDGAKAAIVKLQGWLDGQVQ